MLLLGRHVLSFPMTIAYHVHFADKILDSRQWLFEKVGREQGDSGGGHVSNACPNQFGGTGGSFTSKVSYTVFCETA